MAESGAQLFCRLGLKQSIDGLDNTLFGDLPHPVQAQDVIELYGKEGSGKTQILIHLIANCILPKTWEGLTLGGRGVSVILIDTDYHLPLIRLVEVMEHRITLCVSGQKSHLVQLQSANEKQTFIKGCLARLIVVRCNSSVELLFTLESLDEVLSNRPDIGVMMIDSVSAFYWLDKCNAGDSTYDQEKYQRKLVTLLRKYIQTYYLVTVTTKPAIFHKENKQYNRKEHYEYMCRDWQDLVKYRYVVSRTSPNSTFLFKRVQPLGKASLQFSIEKEGLQFSGGGWK